MNIKEIIRHSLNYPSGDNCQPFRFRILSDTRLEIYHDNKIGAHRLNIENVASMISLGTLIESMSLVAKKQNYSIRPTYHDMKSGEDIVKCADISFEKESLAESPQSSDDVTLLEQLPQRAVDRGLYNNAPIPSEKIDWLKNEILKNSNLSFVYHTKLPTEFKNLLLKIEQISLKDIKMAVDILKWIRFSKAEVETTKDGMPWKTLKLAIINKPLLKLFSVYPVIYKVFSALGSTYGNKLHLKKLIANTGGFGWISMDSAAPIEAINLGRTIMRMWLYLTNQGFSYQPLNFSVLPGLYWFHKKLPPDWDSNLFPLYQEVIKIIQKDSFPSKNNIPIWGFRIGYAKPLKADERTLRYDLEKVLIL